MKENELQVWHDFYEDLIKRKERDARTDTRLLLADLRSDVGKLREGLEWNDPFNSAYIRVMSMIEKIQKQYGD